MNTRIIPLLLSLAYLLSGCSGEMDAGPWTNYKPLNEIDKHIQGYYDASMGEAANPKNGNPTVYVDFSDGLSQAYIGNPENSQIVKEICGKLSSPSVEWYGLENSKISKLGENPFQVYSRIVNSKSYSKTMAPIEEALETIIKSKNDALLITDFEEYKRNSSGRYEEDCSPYPLNHFINWLKKGNSITFFYSNPYTEASQTNKTQKHLYFTVFTYGQPTNRSLASVLSAALGGNFATKVFELNNNPYKVSNDYGGKDQTGVANSTFARWVNYNLNASNDKKLPFEVIGVNKAWDDGLEKYIQDIIKRQDGLFLNKLSLNAADQAAYKLSKVAVKVYDVSDDYENFARSNEASKHTPTFVKDAKKELVWDEKSKKDPIIRACYVSNTTKLKPDWIYKPGISGLKEWPEVFDLDKDVFNGHLKHDPANIELRTILHSNYKQKNIKKDNALLRIDYVIQEAGFNDSNQQLRDFEWNSLTKPGVQNTSLSEAIRNTLQNPDVNPKGKIIYSYYIKFGNTIKK